MRALVVLAQRLRSTLSPVTVPHATAPKDADEWMQRQRAVYFDAQVALYRRFCFRVRTVEGDASALGEMASDVAGRVQSRAVALQLSGWVRPSQVTAGEGQDDPALLLEGEVVGQREDAWLIEEEMRRWTDVRVEVVENSRFTLKQRMYYTFTRHQG